jgi:hypothetical protein
VPDRGGCAGIVRTCHWHHHSVSDVASRYSAEVWAKQHRDGRVPCAFDRAISDRGGGALSQQQTTRGAPGLASWGPPSATPPSPRPEADGRRLERRSNAAGRGAFGRASRPGQAERRAYGGVRERGYGEDAAKRTATSRPLTAPGRSDGAASQLIDERQRNSPLRVGYLGTICRFSWDLDA